MNAARPFLADAFTRFETEVKRCLDETAGQEEEIDP
jgi:hypothetical protein